jgi:hypothetical protein
VIIGGRAAIVAIIAVCVIGAVGKLAAAVPSCARAMEDTGVATAVGTDRRESSTPDRMDRAREGRAPRVIHS